jgi:hypothetical protein
MLHISAIMNAGIQSVGPLIMDRMSEGGGGSNCPISRLHAPSSLLMGSDKWPDVQANITEIITETPA